MIAAQAPRIRRTIGSLTHRERVVLAQQAHAASSWEQVCRLIRDCRPLAEQDSSRLNTEMAPH